MELGDYLFRLHDSILVVPNLESDVKGQKM